MEFDLFNFEEVKLHLFSKPYGLQIIFFSTSTNNSSVIGGWGS